MTDAKIEPATESNGWRDDILGEGFQAYDIPLPDGDDGELTATLVRRTVPRADGRAVLYLHGYSDYFFQTELAEYFADQGVAFYALDLRRHGRSLRPHHVPSFVTDLRDYFAEIDAAVEIMRSEGARRIVVNAHSTGGLIAALWAHDRRDRPSEDGGPDALILNSPWFDVGESLPVRLLVRATLGTYARMRPRAVLPFKIRDAYGQSIHCDHYGEWTFDVTTKPLGGFPVRAGWLHAILKAQRQLHAGLSIRCPVLVMCSSRSFRRGLPGSLMSQCDAVLDVERIARWSVALGPRVTICRIDGGLHDLVLSAMPVRTQVYQEMSTWLQLHVPATRQ